MSANNMLTHSQRVLRLYKKSLRHIESYCHSRHRFRYQATLLRARFDENKDEKDMMKAARLLQEGEGEFYKNQHPQPYIFIDSPEGTRHERDLPAPEWVLDFWHPSERAQYPTYFARYEKRKQWEKNRWDRLVEEEKQLLKGKESQV
ncbi:NADH dehydrogenase [ubiquinone] 1 beta subcomplex subunit 9-like [Saccoglossus kowalevskii]|uniref:NADH dehydrogenase [ubiquinone] 1 beta subcomplex subunit 9 n=1 Tax=Saccoglossus kowalevskii TaxID=10224 RepID=A0ABM0GV20_SACKO|nr:PREDICTED: NADH dehydrogenase [ubiquinone] 1 beta subcomplex subunit 9-like [Saccoglossus kowalevskii]